jgi:hypothetical protein
MDEGNKLRRKKEESLRYGKRQDHKALNIAEEAAKNEKKNFFISIFFHTQTFSFNL